MKKSVIKSALRDGNKITVSNWDASSKILVSVISDGDKIISNVFLDKSGAFDLILALQQKIIESK